MPGKLRKITLRLTIATAKRTRKCKRNSAHKIGPGERLLLLKEPGPASGEHPYCTACATEMISTARQDLLDLKNQLGVDDEH